MSDDQAVVSIDSSFDHVGSVAMSTTTVSIVHRCREEPYQMDSKLLGAFEQLRLNWIS
jgi:hypothetical protein